MELDAGRLSTLLRGLKPLQEKVVRLRYGLGCQRAHSVTEIAQALEVSGMVIAGILDEAHERLAEVGLTARQLRVASGGSHESDAVLNPNTFRARSCRGRSP